MKSRLKMSYNSGHAQAAAAAAAAASAAAVQQQQQQHHHQQLSATSGTSSGHSQQQQYCLKWNNHTNNMVKVFNELLGDENFVDVTLACDGSSIKAHKMVLSACSTYFRDLFINNPCKHPIVILKDIRFDDLRAIIHFMYSGEVNVSYTQLGPLLKTAETLKVKGLTDVNEKHGGQFFGATNGNGSMLDREMNGSDCGTSSLYGGNRAMSDIDSSGMASSPFGGDPGSPGPGSGAEVASNQYLAFMAQRFRKRKRKHHGTIGKNGGSAIALANMLGQNGGTNFASAMAAAAAAVASGANGGSNGMNGGNTKSSTNGLSPTKKAILNHNGGSSGSVGGNGNNGGSADPDDNGESGDEVNSAKRAPKDSNSSNDDSTCNQDDPKSPNSSYHNSSNNSNNNVHMDDGEMMAMALSMARNQQNVDDDDDDQDDRDDGTMNGDDHADSNMGNESLMMGDSDDEFYTDVKPIVSLDESPSPTNSNMDDSYSNSFVAPILENSLSGISPGSQLPNSSTKMCVCHLCHLTFTAYSSLRRHMTRHYADRERYECDICLKSYSRKDYLKEHKKLKHSDVAKVMSSQKSAKVVAAAAAAAAAAGSV